MEGYPEPKIGWLELLLTFQAEQVSANYRDNVTLISAGKNQLILTEHPPGQETEQGPGLDRNNLASYQGRCTL
jgi:hypothetical protein